MTDEEFTKWAESRKPCRYCGLMFVGPVCFCETETRRGGVMLLSRLVRTAMLLVFVTSCSACDGCREQWPDGTKIYTRTYESNSNYRNSWRLKVEHALERWAVAMGPDCPMTYTTTDEVGPGVMHVVLVPNANWLEMYTDTPYEAKTGLWFYDWGIEIRGDRTGGTDDELLHELGHALLGGDGHDGAEPGDLMADANRGDEPTENDIRRVREARGCAAK